MNKKTIKKEVYRELSGLARDTREATANFYRPDNFRVTYTVLPCTEVGGIAVAARLAWNFVLYLPKGLLHALQLTCRN